MNQANISNNSTGIGRAYEGIALSAAFVTSHPLPGDKFSVNFNVADFEGKKGVGFQQVSPN